MRKTQKTASFSEKNSFMTLEEFAKYLAISTRTARKCIKRDGVKHARFGNLIRVRYSDAISYGSRLINKTVAALACKGAHTSEQACEDMRDTHAGEEDATT